MQARLFWSLWQELLLPFALCFTTPGWKRFVEWVTGLALNVEEHTITQSVLALKRPDDWNRDSASDLGITRFHTLATPNTAKNQGKTALCSIETELFDGLYGHLRNPCDNRMFFSRDVRHVNADLTVLDLAEPAAPLPRHAHTLGPLL